MFTRFRSARPSNDLGALRSFYGDGLGLSVQAEWVDHDGFDGLVLGPPAGAAQGHWQIEFVAERDLHAPRAPTDEHLLVLFVADAGAVREAIARMAAVGVAPTPPNNPYWARRGAHFADPDGYGVVVCTVEESQP